MAEAVRFIPTPGGVTSRLQLDAESTQIEQLCVVIGLVDSHDTRRTDPVKKTIDFLQSGGATEVLGSNEVHGFLVERAA